jgi:hypothetical protein
MDDGDCDPARIQFTQTMEEHIRVDGTRTVRLFACCQLLQHCHLLPFADNEAVWRKIGSHGASPFIRQLIRGGFLMMTIAVNKQDGIEQRPTSAVIVGLMRRAGRWVTSFFSNRCHRIKNSSLSESVSMKWNRVFFPRKRNERLSSVSQLARQ